MAQSDSERSSRYRQRKKDTEARMAAAALRRDRDERITGALFNRLFQPAPVHLRPAQSAVLAYLLTETGHDLDRAGLGNCRPEMRTIVERHHKPGKRHLSIEDSRILRKRLLDPDTYRRHVEVTPADSPVTRTMCSATTPIRIADRRRDDTTSDAEKRAAIALAALGREVFGGHEFAMDDVVYQDDVTGLPVCLLPGYGDDEDDDPEAVEARNQRDATPAKDEPDEEGEQS